MPIAQFEETKIPINPWFREAAELLGAQLHEMVLCLLKDEQIPARTAIAIETGMLQMLDVVSPAIRDARAEWEREI